MKDDTARRVAADETTHPLLTSVMDAGDLWERGRAMAAYAGISQIFLAIGPLIDGALTESVSWRVVFWLNVPVGIAALVLVAIAKPPQAMRPERAGGPDVQSAADGITAGFAVSTAAFAVALLVAARLLGRERVAADPAVAADAVG